MSSHSNLEKKLFIMALDNRTNEPEAINALRKLRKLKGSQSIVDSLHAGGSTQTPTTIKHSYLVFVYYKTKKNHSYILAHIGATSETNALMEVVKKVQRENKKDLYFVSSNVFSRNRSSKKLSYYVHIYYSSDLSKGFSIQNTMAFSEEEAVKNITKDKNLTGAMLRNISIFRTE